jgi:hypothetical protein
LNRRMMTALELFSWNLSTPQEPSGTLNRIPNSDPVLYISNFLT